LFQRRAVIARSGVAHQEIQPTPLAFDFVEQALDAFNRAYIRFNQQPSPSDGLDFSQGRLGRSAIAEEVDHHIGAQVGEVQGNGPPNAAPGAGHQDEFVLERQDIRHEMIITGYPFASSVELGWTGYSG